MGTKSSQIAPVQTITSTSIATTTTTTTSTHLAQTRSTRSPKKMSKYMTLALDRRENGLRRPNTIKTQEISTNKQQQQPPQQPPQQLLLQQQQQHQQQQQQDLLFNNNNSKFYCNETMSSRLEYLLDMPHAPYNVQVQHAWNPDDRSLNIFVKELDPFTLHRHPVAQSTDCIRTKMLYTKGIHLFELTWNSRQRGTHAIIGVGTDKTVLHCVGYQSLIGSGSDSWGWDLGRNRACHNTKNSGVAPPIYPKCLKPDENFTIPDTFQMCLDMDEGTLSFLVDGQYLGVAFRGLRGHQVYPIVSAVWGHCEITMKYLNGLDRKLLALD
jgi:SPRY domain-containing SOCS box protein 1/4